MLKNIVKCEESEPKDERALASSLAHTILDSRLISEPYNHVYNVKVVDCNDYVQVYFFEKSHKKNICKNDTNIINNFDELNLFNIENKKSKELKEIDSKNIIRSKLKCQRLAKCNANDWCTFITLTFEENITDINIANKKYKIFIKQLKRVFPNFKCICVPEFQKRGAVHYHLLTNIDINNKKLIYIQKVKINKYIKKFYHINYWKMGFNKVDIVKGDIKKIIGYISKYMTKDVDNRLFNHHRYFYTKNLYLPKTSCLDLNNEIHLNFYNNLLKKKNIIFKKEYLNKYNDEKVLFFEYLKEDI